MIRLNHFRSQLAAAVMAGSFALAAAPGAMANETVALKNALYGAGYEINNVSPQMDDATRRALEAFQLENGLDTTGILNEATKEALGMVSVQVAASGNTSANSSSASQSGSSTSTATAASEPEPEPEAQVEEDEEEDDGSWSFW